jgi:hypothetical protein
MRLAIAPKQGRITITGTAFPFGSIVATSFWMTESAVAADTLGYRESGADSSA